MVFPQHQIQVCPEKSTVTPLADYIVFLFVHRKHGIDLNARRTFDAVRTHGCNPAVFFPLPVAVLEEYDQTVFLPAFIQYSSDSGQDFPVLRIEYKPFRICKIPYHIYN